MHAVRLCDCAIYGWTEQMDARGLLLADKTLTLSYIYTYIYLYTNSLWVHLRVSIHRHDVCPTYGKPVQKYKICCVICFGGIIPPEKLILGPRCPNPKLKNTFSWQKWLFRRIGRASVYVFMWNVSDTAYKSRKVSLKWCKLCPGPHLLHLRFLAYDQIRHRFAQISIVRCSMYDLPSLSCFMKSIARNLGGVLFCSCRKTGWLTCPLDKEPPSCHILGNLQ